MASPILLDYYKFFPSLGIGDRTGLVTSETQILESRHKLVQFLDHNLFSQVPRLCLPLALFISAFDKVHEHYHAALKIDQSNSDQMFKNLLSIIAISLDSRLF